MGCAFWQLVALLCLLAFAHAPAAAAAPPPTQAALLDAEIAASDALIAAHTQRLRILRELRVALVAAGNDNARDEAARREVVVAADGSAHEDEGLGMAVSAEDLVELVARRLEREDSPPASEPHSQSPRAATSRNPHRHRRQHQRQHRVHSGVSPVSPNGHSHSFDPTRWIATRRRLRVPGKVTAMRVVGVPRRRGGASYHQRQRRSKAMQGLDVVAVIVKREAVVDNSNDPAPTLPGGVPGSSILILYNDAGHVLSTLELEQHGPDATVHHVALHFNSRDPVIVTGDDTGSVQVHNVTMYQFGRFVTGRRLPARDYSGRIVNPHGDTTEWRQDGIDVRVEFLKELFHEPGNNPITALAIKRGRSQDMILAADAGGNLHLMMQNGTVAMKFMGDERQQISSVLPGRRGETMAVADGSVLRFLRPPTPKFLPNACEGTTGAITSLARDSMRGQFFYAGTDDGNILVFDITGNNLASRSTAYKGSGGRAGGFTKCALIYKLPVVSEIVSEEDEEEGDGKRVPRATNHGVLVHAIAGYVIGTTSSGHTAAYNTSNVWREEPGLFYRGSRMGAKMGRAKAGGGGSGGSMLTSITQIDGAAAVATGATMVTALAPPGSQTSTISFHSSLLPISEPPRAEGDSLSWLRGPVIVLSVGGVILFQFWKRRDRKNHSPMPDFSAFPGLAKEFGGLGGGGGRGGMPMSSIGIGDGGRGMNPESFESMRKKIERMAALNYDQ